jgi:hypothetical protein
MKLKLLRKLFCFFVLGLLLGALFGIFFFSTSAVGASENRDRVRTI